MSKDRTYIGTLKKGRVNLRGQVRDQIINDRWICLKCNDMLVLPYQTECGCRFCSSCLEELISNSEKCSPDQMEVSSMRKTFDRAVEREIMEVKMACYNNKCKYTCKWRDMDDHLRDCEYEEEQCDGCKETYQRRERSEHRRERCKMTVTKCDDCGMEMTRKELVEVHRNAGERVETLCAAWKARCPHGCGEEMYDSVREHLTVCVLMPVKCVLEDIGCRTVVPRAAMDEHVNNDTVRHMSLMLQAVHELREENERLKLVQIERNELFIQETSSLKRKIEDLSVEIKKLDSKERQLEVTLGLPKTAQSAEERPSSVFVDGEYCWTVDNIGEKIEEAKRGYNVQLMSDSFYTGIPGYKLCLKMYPNGDGKAVGKFLSLFFVLMKGEYDEKVRWPFSRVVSLSLLSTGKMAKNRVINMKPDINTNCYGKPKAELNVAAGSPTFIGHEELLHGDGFLVNGAVTILARVL